MKTPALAGDAAELAQTFLADALNEAQAAEIKYGRNATIHRVLAYGLKAVALFGGLAVATLPVDNRIMGIIISAAVVLDQLLSNHRRLMTESVARNAVARTKRRVQTDYNARIVPIVQANQKGLPDEAREKLIALATSSTADLRKQLDEIQTAVENSRIEFLASLNVDSPAVTKAANGRG
jgi:hypothetical protein